MKVAASNYAEKEFNRKMNRGIEKEIDMFQ